jgi:uncharacterized protein YycO
MKVIFCTSNAPGAVMIRAATWSKWSHVGILLSDGTVVEATWPKVRHVSLETMLSAHTDYYISEYECTEAENADIEAYALEQVGKSYDVRALFGFLVHRDWTEDNEWFCSELVAACAAYAGCDLFRLGSSWRVRPQDIWMIKSIKDYDRPAVDELRAFMLNESKEVLAA